MTSNNLNRDYIARIVKETMNEIDVMDVKRKKHEFWQKWLSRVFYILYFIFLIAHLTLTVFFAVMLTPDFRAAINFVNIALFIGIVISFLHLLACSHNLKSILLLSLMSYKRNELTTRMYDHATKLLSSRNTGISQSERMEGSRVEH